MDELQLEEQQKNIQQRRDGDPYDPNATSSLPGGYTPVGNGEDNTQVEEVSPVNVSAVEVTNPQVEDFINLESISSSGGFIIDGANLKDIPSELLNQLQITPIQNVSLDSLFDTDGNIINTLSDIPDPSDEDQVVDPPLPPVDPPVDPEDPDPEDPEDPDPEDPEDPDPEDPEDPDPEDPEDPDPEDPDPEDPDPEDPDPEDPDPEDPDPEDPSGQNPGNGKDVGNSPFDGITGNSGRNNDKTPNADPMNGQEDDIGTQPGWKGNGPSDSNGNQSFDIVDEFLSNSNKNHERLDDHHILNGPDQDLEDLSDLNQTMDFSYGDIHDSGFYDTIIESYD